MKVYRSSSKNFFAFFKSIISTGLAVILMITGQSINTQTLPPESASLLSVYSHGEITALQLRTLCINGEKKPNGPEWIAVIFRQIKSFCDGYLAGVTDVALMARPPSFSDPDNEPAGVKLDCHRSISDSTNLAKPFIASTQNTSSSTDTLAVEAVMTGFLKCAR